MTPVRIKGRRTSMKLCNLCLTAIVFGTSLNTLCIAETMAMREKPVIKGNTLWGYTLSEETIQEYSTMRSGDNIDSDRVDKDLVARCKASFQLKDPNAQQQKEIVSRLLLLGYHKVEGGCELLIEHIEYRHVDNQDIKYYPSKDALIAYGDDAIPYIINSFENGVSGKKAALLARTLGSIKNAKYHFKEYRQFLLELRKTMSEEAYNSLIKYPAS